MLHPTNEENQKRRSGGRMSGLLRRRRWQAAIGCTALVAVLGSAYAATLPTKALGEKVYCGLEEHVHTSGGGCYERRLACGYAEGDVDGHIHEDDCYQTERKAICGQEESENGHQHSENCFEAKPIVICDQKETGTKDGHVHTDDCYKEVLVCEKQEHTHTLACQSNPGADVETADQWKQTFGEVELSGDWAKDLLAIAKTQIGYAESTQNYNVETDSKDSEDGKETTMGYTRYGAWYGKPYEKWNAMFVSFCLNYANIPADAVPQTNACQDWIGMLSGETKGYEAFDLYRAAGEYEPKAGDLIFLDANGDGGADRVGIVSAYDKDRQKTVHFIEGDASDQVAKMSCDSSDPAILGYAELPKNPNPGALNDGREDAKAAKASAQGEVNIDKFSVQYVSGAEKKNVSGASEWNGEEWTPKADGEAWVWNPTDTPAGHSFVYKVNYTFSGVQTLPAEAVKFTLPAHILRDREGNWADTFDCPYMKDTEVAQGDRPEFIYKVDEEANTVTVYNATEWTTGMSGYIEFSYETSEPTLAYRDLGASADVTAHVAVTTDGSGEKTAQSAAHGVAIDTHAAISSTSKQKPTYYTEWQSKWGAAPEEAEDYYYLEYPIYTYIDKNTQPYEFRLTDTFTDLGGSVLKYRLSGEDWKDAQPDGSAKAERQLTGYGYRYDYVLVKYEKAQAQELLKNARSYTVQNKVTATVEAADGVDSKTTATGSRSWTYEIPIYKPPGGQFGTWKYGLYGKYDEIVHNSEDLSSYELAEYLAGVDVTSIDALRYENYVEGNPYPWTVEAGYTLTGTEADQEHYGKRAVTYELKDESISLNALTYHNDTASGEIVSGKEEKLTNDDYDVTGFRWKVEAKEARFNENKKAFEFTDIKRFEDSLTGAVAEAGYEKNTVYLYAKVPVAGLPKWEKIAEYDLKANHYTYTNPTYVKSADDSAKTIDFAEHVRVKGYQIVTSNAYYYTKVTAWPSVRLNRTAHIAQILTGKANASANDLCRLVKDQNGKAILTKIAVTNKVDGYMRQDERQIFFDDHIGTDYVQAVERHSALSKNVIETTNSKAKKRYSITWQSVLAETYVDSEGMHYVPQAGGAFYDLLPAGAILDTKSVNVRKNVTSDRAEAGENATGKTLIPGEYTYKVIENYEGSGRQMLIVTVEEPTEKGYSLTYETLHAWPSVQDYGKRVKNQIAYQTGNENIADGKADDGTIEGMHLTESKDDDGRGTEKYLYKDAGFTINALIAANTGLTKQVRAQGDTEYTYEATAYAGEAYSYRIRYANDMNTESDGIILMDSIEYFVQSDGSDGDAGGIASDWNGELTGIDTSQLKQKGVDPVVYVSTIPNVNLNEYWSEADQRFDLDAEKDGQNVWKKLTKETDLSNVRAVAIDCGKATSGGGFRLGRGESLAVTLYMQAPKQVTSDQRDPVTYNNIYVVRTAYDAADPTAAETDFYHQDYTQAHYRIVGDVLLKKVNAQNTSEGVKGAVFKLRGTSDYGTVYDLDAVSGRNGYLTFEDIEMGTYELIETASGSDWQLSKEVYTVQIKADGSCTVTGKDGSPLKEDGRYQIPNEPRIHGGLKIAKTDCVTGDKVKGAKFQLSGTSEYGNDILLFAQSGENGIVWFEDIEFGTYTMTEIAAPDGYIRSEETWKVVVDASGAVTLYQVAEDEKLTPVEIGGQGMPVIENEPLHSLTFVKTSTYGTNVRIGGVEFTLTGTSDYGHEVNQTAVSSGEEETYGFVTFSDLEPGTYLLKETKTDDAKDNSGLNGGNGLTYTPDGKSYTVKIRRDGTLTISGLTMIEIASGTEGESVALYNFPNTPDTGVVKVSKVWLDEHGGADREPSDIDITISTQMPELESFGGKAVEFDAGDKTFPNGEKKNKVVFLGNGTPVNGNYAEPETEAPCVFAGWVDGSGKPVAVDESGWPKDYDWNGTTELTLTAQYEKPDMKYVVRLYGVKEDKAPGSSKLGLTFGPATGEDYRFRKEGLSGEEAAVYKSGSGYVAHISKAKADAGETCLHWMTWEQIAAQSKEDPTAFNDCLSAGCTHSVSVTLNEKLRNTDYNVDVTTWTGDGASGFYLCLKPEYRDWNRETENNNGWATSQPRYVLNGAASGAVTTYSGTTYICDESNSLLSCFEGGLRESIAVARKRTSIGPNNGYMYSVDDKLWLFCVDEIFATKGTYHLNYPAYGYYPCSRYTWTKDWPDRGSDEKIYVENGTNEDWYSRLADQNYSHSIFSKNGGIATARIGKNYGHAFAPCFCLQ